MSTQRKIPPERRKIGAQIKAAAKAKGVTQVQLGQWLNKEPAAIGHYFTGRNAVPSEIAPQLAKAVGLKPEQVSEEYCRVMKSAGHAPKIDDISAAIADLQAQLKTHSSILGIMAAVMTAYRPREAVDLAAYLEDHLTLDEAATPVARGLLEALERAKERPFVTPLRRRGRPDR